MKVITRYGRLKMIPIYKPFLDANDRASICDAFDSGWVSSKGDKILQFERNFSHYVGTKFGTSTSNGTTALHLALSALGIGRNDEVIVPDFTFVSPINAVIYQHARPVLVDAEHLTWGIDPDKIRKHITRRTKAIIAVHIYGNSARIEEISEIAKENNIYLIEDCAESIGAKYNGKKVGTFGDISCFSFYGNKIITTGEGGMCLTNNGDLDEKMKILRDHGMNPTNRYWHDVVGYNYRMTNLQAALGVSQLSKIDEILSKKRRIAQIYSENLSSEIILQNSDPPMESVFWLYSILFKDDSQRKEVIKALKKSDIESRSFFYPAHIMPPYRDLTFDPEDLKVSMNLSQRGINLPSYPSLPEDDVLFISNIINRAVGKM